VLFNAGMETVLADFRYAFRSLRQAPGFFSLVIGILALGIATSVSVFSIVDGVLLRPLPYNHPRRLVTLESVATKPPFDSNGSLSYADYEQFQAQSRSFEELAVTYRDGWSKVTLTGGAEPQRIQGAFVSPNLFRIFGRSPLLGRVFTEEENGQGQRVAVLSARLATRRFGSAARALGQDLEIDKHKWRIIGVMPADFQVPFLDTQLWTPVRSHADWIDRSEAHSAQSPRWDIFARLKPSAALGTAQTEVDAIQARLFAAHPDSHNDHVRVVALQEHFTGNRGKGFWVLFASVLFLLLIACANVGNLLLARGAARSREFAVRAALGAGRVRLLQQVLAESVTMCLIAGALGVFASFALVRVLKALAPADTPRLDSVALDGRALLFALALSLAVGIALGFVFAWKSSRREPVESLNASGRTATENREGRRVKSILVACEFALAMVLLTGAALMIRSFAAVMEVDPGFHPEHVLTVRTSMPALPPEIESAFYNNVTGRIRQLPGVTAVGGISNLFFLNMKRMHALRLVEGKPPEPAAAWRPLVWAQVTGSYFPAMGIPLLKGRYFNQNDRKDSPPVVIVNETLAGRY
jgi:predicted permease